MRSARNQSERHTDRTDIRTDEQHYSWRGVYNLLDADTSIEASNDPSDAGTAARHDTPAEDEVDDSHVDVEQQAGDEVMA